MVMLSKFIQSSDPMLNRKFTNVLLKIAKALKNRKVVWAIVGSSNLALQGMKITPKDIDIATNKMGTFVIAQSLKRYEVESVHWRESEKLASYRGKFVIDGVDIEVIGELKRKSIYVNRLKSRIFIKINSENIPCLRLEDELHGYKVMGKLAKARAIKKYLTSLKR